MNNTVLIAHSGRQHSHQVAIALKKEGWLVEYWAGVPCLVEHSKWIPDGIWRKHIRYSRICLNKENVKWLPVAPVLGKVAAIVPNKNLAKCLEYSGYNMFDRWVSNCLSRSYHKYDAIIGYENSALKTFKAAKKLGVMTILDAASFHHTTQDKALYFDESIVLHKKITDQKDKEIELADYILTASELARETYLDAGVPPEKVVSMMLGADIKSFSPRHSGYVRSDAVLTFLFVGVTNYRKGIRELLRAFESLPDSSQVKLIIAGPMGDGHVLVEQHLSGKVQYLSKMSQAELTDVYQKADCFVFPSKMDSFGMVVAEAMACGLPVIVSSMVGAKDLVKHDVNGWIVPVDDVDALSQRMKWCIEHRTELHQMRRHARAAAEEASWDAYHKRLISWVNTVL